MEPDLDRWHKPNDLEAIDHNDPSLPGRWIVFEGGEGSGKSTQVAALAQQLRALDLLVVETREPGGTPLAEAIRDWICYPGTDAEPMDENAELFLLLAARAQHVAQVILPALRQGKWVLCDRFDASTLAYQGFGRGMPLVQIDKLNEWVTMGHCPDLYFLLDIDPKVGLNRASCRDTYSDRSDRFSKEQKAFHERVRQGFLYVAAQHPSVWHRIDATLPVDQISEEIWAYLSHHYGGIGNGGTT